MSYVTRLPKGTVFPSAYRQVVRRLQPGQGGPALSGLEREQARGEVADGTAARRIR